MKKYFFLLLTLMFSLSVYPQDNHLKGTRFWVSFSYNDNPDISLSITAEKESTVKIENPNTSWSTTVKVTAGGYADVPVPINQIHTDIHNTPQKKGILVTSTTPVTVQLLQKSSAMTDVLSILPEELLSDEYIIQNYPDYDDYRTKPITTNAVILATENNTSIDIIPTDELFESVSARQIFTVNLNRGETYLICTQSKDLSGTKIKAWDHKKIAVFNGNNDVSINSDYFFKDYMCEQTIPVTEWGKEFVIVRSADQGANKVRITASANRTRIHKNNTFLAEINASETYELEIAEPETSCVITTSRPCLVYQYMVSLYYSHEKKGKETGDPSMTTVPSFEKRMTQTGFAVQDFSSVTEHYLTVICETSDVSGMRLDGRNISDQFIPVSGNPQYSYAIIKAPKGYHTLKNENGFLAYLYGYGEIPESYFRYLGFSNMDYNLVIKNSKGTVLYKDSLFCPGEPLTFEVSNTSCLKSVTWEFDKKAKSSGASVQHTFSDIGEHTIKMDIETDKLTCPKKPDKTIEITIRTDNYKELVLNENICEGQIYDFYGKKINKAGTYYHTAHNQAGCATEVQLNLSIHSPYQIRVLDTVFQNKPYQKDAFDIQPHRRIGDYQYPLKLSSQYGCDSLVTLYLHVKRQNHISTLGTTLEPAKEVCADDKNFTLKYTTSKGKAIQYSVYFDSKALENGFRDIEDIAVPSGNELSIKIPEGITPDTYSGKVHFYDEYDDTSSGIFEITVLYSSGIITQRWNDVLAVKAPMYNGGYLFSRYQWLKNGKPIAGQTESYLYEPEGIDTNAEYRVLLTRSTDNVTLQTCAFTPTEIKTEVNLKTLPDISYSRNTLTVNIEESAKAVVWNLAGKKISEHRLKAGKNDFKFTQPKGVYVIEITGNNIKSYHKKFSVE